jgi:zinc D-Ala-D-Ala dipeptidase
MIGLERRRGILMNDSLDPIPLHENHENWQNIEIRENGTGLVSISDLDTQLIIEKPQYYLWDIPHALTSCYVREEIAELLIKASGLLPKGYKFLIWDGFRPFEVQKALFDQYFLDLKKANPTLDDVQLNSMTRKYVSYPTHNQESPAPHSTGGAVDLTIVDEKGKPLHMGTEFDAFTGESATRFYEDKLRQIGDLSENERITLVNRRLLYHILIEVGFTNYQEEWWHFDYGNQWWANQVSAPYAKFGMTSL